MDKLIINTTRDAYSTRDVCGTMTVGDLKAFLEDVEDDTPIYLSFDNGYTYGAIRDDRMDIEYGEDYQFHNIYPIWGLIQAPLLQANI